MFILNRASLGTALVVGLLAGHAIAESTNSQESGNAEVSGERADAGLTREDRAAIETMAHASMKELVSNSESMRDLVDRSVGFAVFDSRKFGALITGAGGSGVAVNPKENQCVYMHMGAAGLALGAGAQAYRLVFLFENDAAYDRFVNGTWDGNASAQAAAGKSASESATNFIDGAAVYQITDKGLMAQADLTIMKFWRDRDVTVAGPDTYRCVS